MRYLAPVLGLLSWCACSGSNMGPGAGTGSGTGSSAGTTPRPSGGQAEILVSLTRSEHYHHGMGGRRQRLVVSRSGRTTLDLRRLAPSRRGPSGGTARPRPRIRPRVVQCPPLSTTQLKSLHGLLAEAGRASLKSHYDRTQRPGPNANYSRRRHLQLRLGNRLVPVTIQGWADLPPVLSKLLQHLARLEAGCRRVRGNPTRL